MKKMLLGMVTFLLIISYFNYQQGGNVLPVNYFYDSSQNKITYSEIADLVNMFQVGDIINLEQTNYLSSYAIPGRWKHTLFYLGTYHQFKNFFQPDDKYYQLINSHYQTKDEILILDSNTTGVKIRTFDQMANLKENSYLKAIEAYRFKSNQSIIKTYLTHALDYLETPYDYKMQTYDDQALYCSELIYYALLAINLEITYTTMVLGKLVVITPTNVSDFFATCDNIATVLCLEKENNRLIKRSNEQNRLVLP